MGVICGLFWWFGVRVPLRSGGGNLEREASGRNWGAAAEARGQRGTDGARDGCEGLET